MIFVKMVPHWSIIFESAIFLYITPCEPFFEFMLLLFSHDREWASSHVVLLLSLLDDDDVLTLRLVSYMALFAVFSSLWQVCRGIQQHPHVTWAWVCRAYGVRYLPSSRRLHSSSVDLSNVAQHVLARECRWFSLSWRLQSAIWVDELSEESQFMDGMIITASGSVSTPPGLEALHVYSLPTYEDGRSALRRELGHPFTWAYTWSSQRREFLLLRGESPL